MLKGNTNFAPAPSTESPQLASLDGMSLESSLMLLAQVVQGTHHQQVQFGQSLQLLSEKVNQPSVQICQPLPATQVPVSEASGTISSFQFVLPVSSERLSRKLYKLYFYNIL